MGWAHDPAQECAPRVEALPPAGVTSRRASRRGQPTRIRVCGLQVRYHRSCCGRALCDDRRVVWSAARWVAAAGLVAETMVERRAKMPLIPPEPVDWDAPECVRCGHTPAFHRGRRGCRARLGWLCLRGHCRCPSYVPPGISPEAIEQDLNLRPTVALRPAGWRYSAGIHDPPNGLCPGGPPPPRRERRSANPTAITTTGPKM